MRLKFKFLITTFALFLMFFNSICFATDTNYNTMLISNSTSHEEITTTDSDLYITDSEYEIKDIINGNVFATVDNLNINSSGFVNGNLFVTADTVNIKSDVAYSDTEKDELGNPVISINKASSVSGNAFIIADKFVLNPGCQINGDLYICATEVYLEQNSKINGNVFICADTFEFNAVVNKSLYASSKLFNMKYFGFISNDLHLITEEATLNGSIDRNSIITAKSIATHDKFINQGAFTVKDADNLTFSGKVLGDATLNAKSINFKTKDNDKDLTCKFVGNLSYSSKQEIQLPEGIVSKEALYSPYSSTTLKGTFSSILDYVINLAALLACVCVIYLLISKFALQYLDKLSSITGLGLLKYLGIGLGLLIIIPIISLLLLITGIGSILGLIILFIYIILLIISKPIFIISLSTFAKNKLSYKFNIYLYILAITVLLSLTSLIPYLGFIISIVVSLTGFGMIIRNLMVTKNNHK